MGLQLVVKIISARGLAASNTDPDALEVGGGEGPSDPYCVCMIPRKKRSTVKTKVLRDTLNPVWDFESKVPDYIAGDHLEFSVYDKEFGKKDQLLGSANLPGREFFPKRTWGGELKLELPSGQSENACLKIQVE